MITQQHDNEIQQKAQAPSPAKLHRWIVVLLSILGVAVPLVVGFWFEGPLPRPDIFPANDWILPLLFYVTLPVTVGAFLLCFALRAWWVAVFTGLAWYVGEVLGAVVVQLIEGSSPQLLAWDPFWSIYLGGIGALALVPLIIGMAIGGGVGLALGKRRALRQ